MGRVASAHLGQRNCFLIAAIDMHRVAWDFRRRVQNGEVSAPIARWTTKRSKTRSVEHTLPLMFLVFQDDMLELVVGDQSQSIMANIETSLTGEECGVEFKAKPGANQPFETEFEFIGAEFDTSDAANVRRRPAQHVIQNVERGITWVQEHLCRLVDCKKMQTVVGRLTFCSRFVDFGRKLLKSSYATLAGARHLQCRSDKAMITAEIDHEVDSLVTEIRLEHWTPLVSSPEFSISGAQGVSTDASASLCRGWGAHAFGTIASGTWAPTTLVLINYRRLSINPLELLATEATVVLLDKVGKIPCNRQVVLRGDNFTAYNVSNTGIAYSQAMRFALGVFVDVFEKTGTR